MVGTQRIHWTGLTAMVGGMLCSIYGTLLALRPPGIPGGPHRNSDDLGVWITVGLVLIVVGMIGLYVQHGQGAGGLGKVAVGLAVVGVALITASNITSWWVFAAGFLAIVLSLLVFGVAVLLAGVFPFWVSTLMCITAGCLFLFNTEDARAWLLVPFGVVWVVLGYIILSRKYVESLRVHST